jgi:hypothetical protein
MSCHAPNRQALPQDINWLELAPTTSRPLETPHAHPSLLSATTLAASLLLTACASHPSAPTTLAEVGELRPGSGYAKGYLSRDELPDSLALVPPPRPKARLRWRKTPRPSGS